MASSSSPSTPTSVKKEDVWADRPFKLITQTGLDARPEVPKDHFVIRLTKDMALVHNLVLRGLNAAYHQCLAVSPGTAEARDFLIWNQCLFEFLKSHHDMEEEHLFPALEDLTGKPGSMANNVREHKDFEASLLQYRDYVFETDPESYDGARLKSLIDAFGPLVEKHLHNEIVPMYDLHVTDSEALRALWKRVEKDYQPNFDKYR